MKDNKEKRTVVEQAVEDLFNYAIERDDIKWLMGQLHQQTEVKPTTVAYELQILKIVAVGWGISYYLEGTPKGKTKILEPFWRSINDFSKELSETTGLMIGQDIDYFQILKQRLDQYLKAMDNNPEAKDPSEMIGPAFAKVCGKKEDIFASITGAKLFSNTIARVRQYLETVKLR